MMTGRQRDRRHGETGGHTGRALQDTVQLDLNVVLLLGLCIFNPGIVLEHVLIAAWCGRIGLCLDDVGGLTLLLGHLAAQLGGLGVALVHLVDRLCVKVLRSGVAGVGLEC